MFYVAEAKVASFCKIKVNSLFQILLLKTEKNYSTVSRKLLYITVYVLYKTLESNIYQAFTKCNFIDLEKSRICLKKKQNKTKQNNNQKNKQTTKNKSITFWHFKMCISVCVSLNENES